MTETIYPLSALRAVALEAQGLVAPAGEGALPDAERIYSVVEKLGSVQIDTLQMVQRSHFLVPWSRLGRFDPADFARLVYRPGERRLFEYWKHAACYIPLSQFRYSLPKMRRFREGYSRWYQGWLDAPGNAELIAEVFERIRQEGAKRAADFEYNGARRGAWWDWKPAKQALEHLYNSGELMITDRVNFQRVYDLQQRVLPDWVNQREPSKEETSHFFIEEGVRSLGVCSPVQAAEYAHLTRGEAKRAVEAGLREGVLIPIKGRMVDGSIGEWIVHRANLPLLERAAQGEIRPRRTTFLSPFDNLFWARGRDEQLWGFQQRLEAYKPQKDRIWGYFCLPVLHRERLAGRFDPKLDRKTGTLYLKALYLEPGIEPDDELVCDVAAAMRDFLVFHQAGNLVVERSQPVEFGEKLLKTM